MQGEERKTILTFNSPAGFRKQIPGRKHPKKIIQPLLAGFVIAGLFSAVLYALAAPPATPYAPGETTNPTCGPTDVNCTVYAPVTYLGASADVDLDGHAVTASTGTFKAMSVGSGTAVYYTFPVLDGSSGQFISTNGSGVLTWATATSGITSLNGLSGASQTFATSSAGFDFDIVSSGSTHTFYLPTASSTSRGLLSSADWSTFNAKENFIATGTAGQYWRGDKSWQNLNAAAVGLGAVENTALSTWPGSTNITTLGTIGTGTWNATAIDVAYGGTGNTSTTPFAILAGGTTPTGVLQQVSGVGTLGQVLTSNGPGFLPTWQTASVSANTALSNLATTSINASLVPNASGTYDLGSSTLGWKDGYFAGKLYVAGGIDPTYINLTQQPTVPATPSAGTNLLYFDTLGNLNVVNSTGTTVQFPTTNYLTGNYVPYTGATTAVNLGAQNLTTTGTGSFGIFQLGTTSTAGYVLTTDANGIGTWQAGAAAGANTTLSNLTDTIAINKSLLPNASGTLNIGSSIMPWANIYGAGDILLAYGATRTLSVGQAPLNSGAGYNLVVRAGDGNCFAAGTKVTMVDGPAKNIEEIKVGDVVESYDLAANKAVAAPVTKVFIHPAQTLNHGYLVIKTDNNIEIKVTPDHLIYNFGTKSWSPAGDFKAGDRLMKESGQPEEIVSVEKVNKKISTFNLEVEKYHLYFAQGILVHNLKAPTFRGGDLYLYGGFKGNLATPDSYNGNVILGYTGTATRGLIGIGTPSPAYLLDVSGTANFLGFRMPTGATSGYVLTADASGIGTWQAATGGGGGTNYWTGNTTTYNLFSIESGANPASGTNNFFVGNQAGLSNNQGIDNFFVGYEAGEFNTQGSENFFVGYQAGLNNTTGNSNIAVGYRTGLSNTEGYSNIFLGGNAGYYNDTGSYNVFIGQSAGALNSTGTGNTALGSLAGWSAKGDNNVFLGYYAGYNEIGSNKLYISNSSTNWPLIYGDFGTSALTINGTLGIANGAGTTYYTFPQATGTAGQVLTNNGSGILSWATSTAGANTALSNLATTSINASLVPNASGTYDLGSSTLGWKDGYFAGKLYVAGGIDPTYINLTQQPTVPATPSAGTNLLYFDTLGNLNVVNSTGTTVQFPTTNYLTGNYVPYTGATTAVNLGAQALTTTGTGSFGTFRLGAIATSGYVLTTDANGIGTWQVAAGGGANFWTGNTATHNIFSFDSGANTSMAGTDNFFAGHYAGGANTTGVSNNFLGAGAGSSNISGNYNNFLGNQAGLYNDTGYSNNFLGNHAGLNNTSGNSNNFLGDGTGQANTTGNYNNFLGVQAGYSNTSGSNNLFLGYRAGFNQTTNSNLLIIDNQNRGSAASETRGSLMYGSFNADPTQQYLYVNGKLGVLGGNSAYHTIFQGNTQTADITYILPVAAGTAGQALSISSVSGNTATLGWATAGGGTNYWVANTTTHNLYSIESGANTASGTNNFFVGYQAGATNTTGGGNNFIGNQAGASNTTGPLNNFIGYRAGFNNTTGDDNNMFGYYAGYHNTTGANNFFVGQVAGLSNTTGGNNNFLGRSAGGGNTTGSYNNFMGFYAGQANTSGSYNVFQGYQAGYSNTTGNNIVAIGNQAGYNFVGSGDRNNVFLGNQAGYGGIGATGTDNFFVGYQAGYSNTSGYSNIFQGSQAGIANTTGYGNIFQGYQAGASNTTGYYNNFIGYQAGTANTTGNSNTFLGYYAGYGNTEGVSNVFIGSGTGWSNTTGIYNTFVGSGAGGANSTGEENNFFGESAGSANTSGAFNNFMGWQAGRSNTGGYYNTYLGNLSGFYNDGSSNVFLGNNAGYNQTTTSNVFIVDNQNRGSGASETRGALIYGSFNATPKNQYLYVNGQLGILGGNSAYHTIFQGNTQSADITYLLPAAQATASGQVLTNNGSGVLSWATQTVSANTSLSNLAATSINASLVPNASGTFDLGSSTAGWKDGYFAGKLYVAGGIDPTYITLTQQAIAPATPTAGQNLLYFDALGNLNIVNSTGTTIPLPTTNYLTGNYVPYTGATTTVNLGGQNLTTTGTGSFGAFRLGTSATPGYVLTADASGTGTWQLAAGGGAPGGATTSIQYNNNGAFGGFGTWNGTTLDLGTGTLNVAGGTVSNRGYLAVGESAVSNATGSVALGYQTTASGNWSTAIGTNAIASGKQSTAIGPNATAGGLESIAIGNEATAGGIFSTAIGESTTASGSFSTAMGYYTTASGDYQTTIGKYNVPDITSAFIIGNGTSFTPSNALTVDWSGNLTTAGTGSFGAFRLGTSATPGYVLTADASGTGTWQLAAGGGGEIFWTGNTTTYNLFSTTSGANPASGGGNFFAGRNAGFSNNTGGENNFIGSYAGQANTSGIYNTFLGSWAGISNTAGSYNNFIGWQAGYSNSTGSNNIFLGNQAGYNETGDNKLYISNSSTNYPLIYGDFGTSALTINGTLAIGDSAGNTLYTFPQATGTAGMVLTNNGSGVLSWATVSGGGGTNYWVGNTTTHNLFSIESGANTASGTDNFFAGYLSGYANNTGWGNTFLGNQAGASNTTGVGNNFLGYQAGSYNTIGTDNNFLGLDAGHYNTTGVGNVFIGSEAGALNTEGGGNVFQGFQAGEANSTGNLNLFMGSRAGYSNSTGSNDVFLGNQAGYNETGDNKLYISNSSTNYPLIYGDFGTSALTINGTLAIGDGAGTTLYTFPQATGTAGMVLTNNGSGVLSWAIVSGGGGTNYWVANTTSTHNLFSSESTANISSGSYNFFAGYLAGASNTTGFRNNFIGDHVGQFNTTGNVNNFLGSSAGYSNTTGNQNVFLGNVAGYSNTSGSWNNFMGSGAGYANTTGKYNNFIGFTAGNSNTSGSYNIFLGYQAGTNNTTGVNTIAIGSNAGYNFDGASDMNNVFLGNQAGYGGDGASGTDNFFVGYQAGFGNTSGFGNIFLGNQAGASNTTGYGNNFLGYQAGSHNTVGTDNNFIGLEAGTYNTTGMGNVFIGSQAGGGNTEGSGNVFQGYQAGETNATGNFNLFMGSQAGYSNSTGSNNIFLGNAAGYYQTGSDTLVIDNQQRAEATGSLIYGSFNATPTSQYLYINGKLGIGGINNYHTIFQGGSQGTDITYTLPAAYGTNGQVLSTDASGTLSWASVTGGGGETFWTGNTTTWNLFSTASGANPAMTGQNNFFVGYQAGIANATGSGNNFIGSLAGQSNTTGNYNNFIGVLAGYQNTTGVSNNFIGYSAGSSNLDGYQNNFMGEGAGESNTSGHENIFFGFWAGFANAEGNNEVAIGNNAGYNFDYPGGGDLNNVFLGNNAGYGGPGANGTDNFFVGYQSGAADTSGASNIFFGNQSGWSNTAGNNNTFVGNSAGYGNNQGDSTIAIGVQAGYYFDSTTLNGLMDNVFLGYQAGYGQSGISSGADNFFVGYQSGYANTTGASNIFLGNSAGYSNTEGVNNNFQGPASGYYNTTGNNTIAIGNSAGYNFNGAGDMNNIFLGNQAGYGGAGASGTDNFFAGNQAGRYNTSGYANNFLGYQAGYNNTTGYYNNFLGYQAGQLNTTAQYNNFIGAFAGQNNTIGAGNNFVGVAAGQYSDRGYYNNFIGYSAGQSNTSGSYNVFLGAGAGVSNTTGSYNVFLGQQAGYYETTASNLLIIDNQPRGFIAGSPLDSTQALIYGGFGTATSTQYLYVNGKFGILGRNSNYHTIFQGATQTADITYTLPAGYGSAGQVLTTDASGILSWATAGGATLWYQPTPAAASSSLFSFTPLAGNTSTTGAYNFFAGYQAGATNSSGYGNNFLGYQAGLVNTGGYRNVFLGYQAGASNTTGVDNIYIGTQAGNGTSNSAGDNILIGYQAGDPIGTSFAVMIGYQAGHLTPSAANSNFIGNNAGASTTAAYSNFLGYQAGEFANGATAQNDNFLGQNAGYQATNASSANFLGYQAGQQATNASWSNFLGQAAGYSAASAQYSNFLGYQAGYQATNASNSNFFGYQAGQGAASASYSNFMGYNAGYGASSSGSVFLGSYAGQNQTASNLFIVNNQNIAAAAQATGSLMYGTFNSIPSSQTLVINAKTTITGPSGITSFTGNTGLGLKIQGSKGATDYSGIDFTGSNVGTGVATPTARIGVLTGGSGSSMQFGTSNNYASGITNTAMTIHNAGQIEIGTPTPTESVGFTPPTMTVWDYNTHTTGTYSGAGSLLLYNTNTQNNTEKDYGSFLTFGKDFNGTFTTRAAIKGAADQSGSSGNGYLAFYTGTGLANTLTEKMRITSAGNVGIGESIPTYILQVDGEPAANGYTAWTDYSDENLKKNINPLGDGVLSKIMELSPSSFQYNDTYFSATGYNKSSQGRTLYGFIAQQLQQVFPEMVGTGTSGYLTTNLSNLPIYLVKAVQEQQKEIDILNNNLGMPINASGTSGAGAVSGVTDLSVGQALSDLGMTLSDGVANLKEMVTAKLTADNATINDKIIAKTAKMDGLELVDRQTGETYCTWISNGEWQKAKGDCNQVEPALSSGSTGTSGLNNFGTTTPETGTSGITAVNISSLTNIPDITIEYGTPLSSANLPATVTATMDDNSTRDLSVSWDNGTPAYDPNTAGIYNFSGTITLPDGVNNINNLKASVNVIVEPQQEQQPVGLLYRILQFLNKATGSIIQLK